MLIVALTVGRECHSWHGVHAGLSDVFEVHRDVPERHTLTVSTLEGRRNTKSNLHRALSVSVHVSEGNLPLPHPQTLVV